jgi:hypothetical protein
MKLMYRVSNELRTKKKQDKGITTVYNEQEQCGSFYYFTCIHNAARASIEFETMFVPVRYCPDTNKSDNWYQAW